MAQGSSHAIYVDLILRTQREMMGPLVPRGSTGEGHLPIYPFSDQRQAGWWPSTSALAGKLPPETGDGTTFSLH